MSTLSQIGPHRTTIFTENNATRIIYHQTPVVTFTPDTITLNTGGFFTATTKRRMNQTSKAFDLGYVVFQKNNQWYVTTPGGRFAFTSDTITLDRTTMLAREPAT